MISKSSLATGHCEVMAPVGDMESLAAAIQGGANSVYFGVEQLNMRAKSTKNFTLDDMAHIAKKCQKYKMKCYLTLNTILYDHDTQLMKKMIDRAKEAGVNAVIASDVAVFQYANSIGLPVHISTQANVCNIETLKFYTQFADVVVLARELTLTQIQRIAQAIKEEQIKGIGGELMRIKVTRSYGEVLDDELERKKKKKKATKIKEDFYTVYNRGFWEGGYYMGKELGEWSGAYGSHSTVEKEYVAKCTKYYSKSEVAEILMQSGNIKIGDKVMFIGPTTGVIEFIIESIHFENGLVEVGKKDQMLALKVPRKIRKNDRLYLLKDRVANA